MDIKILKYFLSVGIFSVALSVHGQTLKAYEKKAMEAYESKDYPAALAYNRILLEIDSQRVDALFMSGEAARQLRVFDLAENYLEQIPDSSKNGLYVTTDFRLASSKKGLGKYNEAALYYRKYLETHPDTSDVFVKRAAEELEFCEWAMEMVQNPANIEIEHLDTNINTVYSDFAPLRFADKIYFTSAFVEDTAAAPVNRIYTAIQDDPKQLFKENTTEKGTHSSQIALTADGRRMYYTICNNKEFPNEYGCEIWTRELAYEGHWGPPKKLPKNINLEGFTATQPSNGLDKSWGRSVLFFASDRPGGKGNLDIWCSILEPNGDYGEPFPLPFNTPQDDITPYFHMPSQTLFFSSGGLKNLGGYDVFRSVKLEKETWSEPENMGYPLNSSYDDLYYTFNSASKTGYFASNRPGCLCSDPAKGCKCNDIYSANIKVDLNAWTFNAIDSRDLPGVTVELFDMTENRVDTFYENTTGNKFYYELDLEKNYRLTATKKGWELDTATISTEGINYFKTFERLLYLKPKVELIVQTFNEIDSSALNATTVVLTENSSTRSTIFQNNETTNECSTTLEIGKTYSIYGTKEGYSADYAAASTLGFTKPDTILRKLYLSPFEGLPLELYFDNAKPDYVNKIDTTTLLTYGQTYREFLRRKPAFVKGYSAKLKGPAKQEAIEEIETFFRDSVVGNFDKLEAFAPILEKYLASLPPNNKGLEVIIEGFASPLASPEYNHRLTGRRVSSVVNHFRAWKNGALVKFFDNGKLRIKEEPRGEKALPGVSDDGRNRRLSVFSPAASQLRKVTITEIRPFKTTGRVPTK